MKLNRRAISLLINIGLIAALLAFFAPAFFEPANLRDLLISNVPVLIVALGMTLVILTGQIDISVGSQFALASVAAGVLAKSGLPNIFVALAAAAIGVLLGSINGALVAKVRIPSIVVTLATMVALRDALRWATEGAWVENLPSSFQWFGGSQAWSDTISVATTAALAIFLQWSLRNLAAGRAVYAVGSNEQAARLAGIEPGRITFAVFAITGALTGLAAMFNAVRFHQVPSNSGLGMEMRVIAAVIVGGTSVTGGKGSIAGTVLGVVLLAIIGPALTFLGVSAYWERALQGGIILTAVAAEAIGGSGRKALDAQPA